MNDNYWIRAGIPYCQFKDATIGAGPDSVALTLPGQGAIPVADIAGMAEKISKDQAIRRSGPASNGKKPGTPSSKNSQRPWQPSAPSSCPTQPRKQHLTLRLFSYPRSVPR